MKIGVVQFPGSNCDHETKLALQRAGFEPVDCFWHADAAFVKSLDGFIIVGGFSYEDRVRSGLIASKDPFMRLLAEEAEKGKPILGICNGAQIIVESGLLGGAVALTANQRMRDGKLLGTGFYNGWVEIQSNRAPTNHPIHLPIAHAEGRFLIDDKFYQELQQAGAVFYTYCGENPNGSMHHLAAVSNAAGNVMAMMPHPERTPAGDIILKTFFNAKANPAHIKPRYATAFPFKPYVMDDKAQHYWVSLMIHDNEAISLENTLQEMGLPVSLKKLIHWEVSGLKPHDEKIIRESGELFNDQKECLVDIQKIKGEAIYILRQKDDESAELKEEILKKQLGQDVKVNREVVWVVNYPQDQAASIKKVLEGESIFGNPLSHEGYTL